MDLKFEFDLFSSLQFLKFVPVDWDCLTTRPILYRNNNLKVDIKFTIEKGDKTINYID